MLVLKQEMALAYDLPFWGRKVCPLGCLEKARIPSPFLRSCQKLGGEGRSHFHVNNSLLVIPFFVWCSTKIDSIDLFWLHVEFTCVRHTSKNAVSPRDQNFLPVCPV